ncbi:CBS domain-containing protein CBSX5-like [Argentina anserina]|uniref:CBS domain-containing protein CBSX5-like n=1 Tax=Argentina anserina TaxID=57926 RepID=UPI0021765BDD|nr:CBS domain-containing protein CBSX5-like [Potentilla anserina]
MSQPRSLFSHEVADLCLGKPPLKSVSIAATVGEALSALKALGETFLSVWSCNHAEKNDVIVAEECRCVGKICMLDVIVYLGREENLSSPAKALEAPVEVLIRRSPAICLVSHLEPHASLVEAMDLILEGAQNLVIPLQRNAGSRKKLLHSNSLNPTTHNDREYCWLTQEDIVRYLLNSIGYFSHVSNNSISDLQIIDSKNMLAVRYDDPALAALPLIAESLVQQTSVAILDGENKVMGEISPYTLNTFHESVAAAIATLSAWELMAYIDCGGPSDDLVQLVKDRLQEKKYEGLLELMEEDFTFSSSSSICSTSSDEEFGQGRSWRLGGYSARLVRRAEAIVCYPCSSLVAVMVQALCHRVSYVWVVEEDRTLSGIVTFASMFKVFRERLRFMA